MPIPSSSISLANTVFLTLLVVRVIRRLPYLVLGVMSTYFSSSHQGQMLLYGGGFLVAALQVSAVYYGTAILLHWLVPQIWSVKSIQVQPRQPGQVAREALYSLGALPQRPDLT